MSSWSGPEASPIAINPSRCQPVGATQETARLGSSASDDSVMKETVMSNGD